MLNCSYSSILAAFLFQGIVFWPLQTYWPTKMWALGGSSGWFALLGFFFFFILGGLELFCTWWSLCTVLKPLFLARGREAGWPLVLWGSSPTAVGTWAFLFPLLCWVQSNQDVWPQVFSTTGGFWTDLSLTSGGRCFFAFLFLSFLNLFFGDICFLSVFYYRHSSWKTSVFHMCSVLQKVWRLVRSTNSCFF